MIFRNKKVIRIIALGLLLDFTFYTFFPTISYALTAGPNAPEFSGFTPVATTDMVNLFTGDFSYNLPVIEIPGAEGGGYALSLNYQSGYTSEQEASWVGFGWSLNPGSINRSVRGFPDDYNGDDVQYYNKMRPNWSVSMAKNAGMEVFTKDVPIDLSISSSLRFNNHQGYYTSKGFGIGSRSIGSLNVNFDNDGVTFSGNIDPLRTVQFLKRRAERKASDDQTTKTDEDQAAEEQSETTDQEKQKKEIQPLRVRAAFGIKQRPSLYDMGLANLYGSISHASDYRATHFSKYKGFIGNWSVSAQVNPTQAPVGFEVGRKGTFSLKYNENKAVKQAHGYFNSDKADPTDVLDYYREKGSSYDKRDVFIGMPFANYDVFGVSGEGLMGSFRGYNTQLGHYRPNAEASELKIRQMGYEYMVGANLGVGLDFGFGNQETKIDDWSVENRGSFANNDNLQNTIFRFSHDPGGTLNYTTNTQLQSASVKLVNPVYGFRKALAVMDKGDADRNDLYKIENDGRSSFIKPTLDGSGKIIGYAITNGNGVSYNYQQPVFVRNETHLSVDIQKNDEKKWRYLAFRNVKLSKSGSDYLITDTDLNSQNFQAAIGEIRNEKYANNYLLTAILSPDYVDRTSNGPTQDDFGGWTKFKYRKRYGEGESQWYRYRTPYNGLLYNQNAISDTKDDLGSFSTGEKEVFYLDFIETNTHKAYFVTNKTTSDTEFLRGSGADRHDGLGAIQPGTEDQAATKPGASGPWKGSTGLEFLEKIVLVAKTSTGEEILNNPLKVVHFEYDWSLVPNVANNTYSTYGYGDNSSNNVNANSGKLTLKKVWFEYRGVKPARISPYEFDYAYKHSSTVGDSFNHLFAKYDDLSDNEQNPAYAPHMLSPWGYPMANGQERKDMGIPWIDQGAKLQDGLEFDPAAWQLKKIKLPSGGEIHIQYEEDDYAFVQDRPAMAMASLAGSGEEGEYSQDQSYYVRVEDLGVDPLDAVALAALETKVTNYFLDENGGQKEKIYFKFLYALKDIPPSVDDCRSEYITGYANFKSAAIEDHTLPGGMITKVLKVTLASASGNRAPIPRQACYELVSNQRQGKLDNSDCEDPDYEARFDQAISILADAGQSSNVTSDIRKNIAKKSLSMMSDDERVLSYDLDSKGSVCKQIEPTLSFLKLPLVATKKGGGLRVKRLLMYDEGLESGGEVVHGSEYHYALDNGVSSGVATTEPGAAREENPLVTFIPKEKQSFFSRITTGEDKEQTEGPLGESLLPAASVGYSRVIVQNIHTGKTGTGYTVNDFYTAKDFPFDRYYGPADDTEEDSHDTKGAGVMLTSLGKERKTDFINIPAGLFYYSTSKVWTAQGFRFILNDMHGKTKRVAQYGGTYENTVDDGYQVAYQEYEYFAPGEKIRLLYWDTTTGSFQELYDVPGKEMDMTFESRRIEDTTIDFNVEIDISIGIAFLPPIFVNVMPSFDHSDRSIATHATTKVLRYPAMVRKVISNQDGITSINENLAFNASTGEPLLTRSYDSFHGLKLAGAATPHDGSMYQFSIPAEWMYRSMGQKASNIDNTNQLSASTAVFTTYGKEPDLSWFNNPTQVTSASVHTFSRDWSSSWTDPLIDSKYGTASNATELNQIWRPATEWVYKANGPSSVANNKIYSSGYFSMANMFDWTTDEQADNGWIRTSQITKYSPHGNPLEEKNVLNIPSSVIYGQQYGNHLPVMIAQNATQNNIFFQDYENVSGMSSPGHSGKNSRQILSGAALVQDLRVTSQLIDKGGLFLTWLNFASGEEEVGLELNLAGSTVLLQKVNRVGDWTLFQAQIPGAGFAAIGLGNPFSCGLQVASGSFSQVVKADDVRFQPWDAEAACYVYDATTFDLIAQFDDQHFGLFYQYNDEGQLVRKIIETERGNKTVQESQYNIKKTSP